MAVAFVLLSNCFFKIYKGINFFIRVLCTVKVDCCDIIFWIIHFNFSWAKHAPIPSARFSSRFSSSAFLVSYCLWSPWDGKFVGKWMKKINKNWSNVNEILISVWKFNDTKIDLYLFTIIRIVNVYEWETLFDMHTNKMQIQSLNCAKFRWLICERDLCVSNIRLVGVKFAKAD